MQTPLSKPELFRIAFDKGSLECRVEELALSRKDEAMCRQLVMVDVDLDICVIGAIK